MMQGLYSGVTGLKTHSDGLQIISNNIANVNTVAYKQQLMLFQEQIYDKLSLGGSMDIVSSARGLGVTMGATRTLFNEGAFELASAVTDLAIDGKGFFQVTDAKGQDYYTRAGNFGFDAQGVLRDANGLSVTGMRIQNGGATGGLGAIELNMNDEAITTNPPLATTALSALMNLNVTTDRVSDEDNPYFSLLSAWDGTLSTPLSATDASIPLSFYDSEGTLQELTIYVDAAPSPSGQKVFEYIIAMSPSLDGREGIAGTEGAGLLMAGTLTFSSAGELTNMSAFTPGSGDMKDLSNWTLAELVDGVPSLSLTIAGQPAQSININLGMTGTGWENTVASAADVTDSMTLMPKMSSPTYDSTGTTAYAASSALKNYTQNGHTVGYLYDIAIDASGILSAHYSNGQAVDLYQIPLFRFTSEDGLRREGNNLYLATSEAGNMSYGMAGTENYGGIQSNYLESSNVDMSKEMTNMIIIQRGFQSNSKSITTLDTMIQKALELKRT